MRTESCCTKRVRWSLTLLHAFGKWGRQPQLSTLYKKHEVALTHTSKPTPKGGTMALSMRTNVMSKAPVANRQVAAAPKVCEAVSAACSVVLEGRSS